MGLALNTVKLVTKRSQVKAERAGRVDLAGDQQFS